MARTTIAGAEDTHGYKLSVNSYDRGASLLISLLVMVGVAVLALVIIWYATHYSRRKEPPTLLPVTPAGRPADAAMGLKDDIEPPGVEDAPELSEPQLQDTLTELSNLSSKSAMLSDVAIDSDGDVGKGSGFGDAREVGMGGDGPPLKEPKREIRFNYADRTQYLSWLAFWKVELAVIDQRNNRLYYVSNFNKARPDVREVNRQGAKENRIYFISNGTPFEEIDRSLLQKAGVAGRGNIILQFWPDDSAKYILGLEDQAWKKKGESSLASVRRSVFKVVPRGSRFEWELVDMVYY